MESREWTLPPCLDEKHPSTHQSKQIFYYIRWYQDRIIRLADQVFHKLQETRPEDPQRLNLIYELLEEFRLTFQNDFDLSRSIPIALHTNEHTILPPVAGELEVQLGAEGISDDLKKIALIPFRELFQSGTAPVSFHQLYYVRYYAKELSLFESQIRNPKKQGSCLSRNSYRAQF